MALKIQINNLDEVAEPIRPLYAAAEGGGFRLQVEDAVPRSELEKTRQKVEEFRTNNIQIMKERDELAAKMKTPSPAPTAEVVQIDAAQKAQIEELRKRLDATLAEVRGRDIEREALTYFTSAGGHETAVGDFLPNVTKVFQMIDGKPVAKDASGNVIFSRTDPSTPISVQEYIETLRTQKPYFFKSATGGGAVGSGSGGVRYEKPNPYSKGSVNLTEQWNLEKTQPKLAAQLRAEAKK